MHEQTGGTLPGDFQQAAAHKHTVTLQRDSAALDWLKAANRDNWQEELNGFLLFYHENSGFQPDGFEPGEMAAPPLEFTA